MVSRTDQEPVKTRRVCGRIDPEAFWLWAYSDFLSNANRGLLADYLVGCALGCDMCGSRREWDRHDLETRGGVTIEVKASGYVQSWAQQRPSSISFDIGRSRAWSYETNTTEHEPSRSVDIYLFCVRNETDRARADALDPSQWHFAVVTRRELDRVFGEQKRMTLAPLLRRLEIETVTYDELSGAFERARASLGPEECR
jgi:hypothetical protein